MHAADSADNLVGSRSLSRITIFVAQFSQAVADDFVCQYLTEGLALQILNDGTHRQGILHWLVILVGIPIGDAVMGMTVENDDS